MNMTSFVRKVDSLGRVVLPVEVRRQLGIGVKSEVELSVEDGKVVLRRPEHRCVFCGSGEGLLPFEGKEVCLACVRRLSQLR